MQILIHPQIEWRSTIAHAYISDVLAPPTSLDRRGVIQKTVLVMNSYCEVEEREAEATLPIFDEYGFLVPRGDQDGLESRSHEYRCVRFLSIDFFPVR